MGVVVKFGKAGSICMVWMGFALTVLLVRNEACSNEDIGIYSGEAAPLPNGIPSYSVQIINKCSNDCSLASIHLKCGMFSSATLINPRLFRRLAYDDCLVNDGKPLPPDTVISFQYSNTLPYHLTIASLVCL
ncbi:hypothetical protein PIB30_020275 [Stylosanthes scabra]|uniref:Uncharacterized protein n=1 Tax=Stylosanthes scabra TaxID=79078 RepID=A0ABU6U7T0_9FABA|nr:hypothetical protein [Stylosanthes scabra]